MENNGKQFTRQQSASFVDQSHDPDMNIFENSVRTSTNPMAFSFGVQQPTIATTINQQTTNNSPSQGVYQLPYNLPLTTVVTVLVQSGSTQMHQNSQRVRRVTTNYSETVQFRQSKGLAIQNNFQKTIVSKTQKGELSIQTNLKTTQRKELKTESNTQTSSRNELVVQSNLKKTQRKELKTESNTQTSSRNELVVQSNHQTQQLIHSDTIKSRLIDESLKFAHLKRKVVFNEKSCLAFSQNRSTGDKSATLTSNFETCLLLIELKEEKVVKQENLISFCECLSMSPESEFIESKDLFRMPTFKFDKLAKTSRQFRSIWGRKEAIFRLLSANYQFGNEFTQRFKEEVERIGFGLWAIISGEKREVLFVLVAKDEHVFDVPSPNSDYRDLVDTLSRITPSNRLALGPEDESATVDFSDVSSFKVEQVLPEKEKCELRGGKTHVPKATSVTLFGKGLLAGFFSKAPVLSAQKQESLAIAVKTADQLTEFTRTHNVRLAKGFSFSVSSVEKFLQEKFPVRFSKLKKDLESERQKIESAVDKTDIKVFEKQLNFIKTMSIVNAMSILCPSHLNAIKNNAVQKGNDFKLLLEEVLANKDKGSTKDDKDELNELEGVFQNVLLESDKQAIQKYAKQKQLSETAVSQMIEKPRKACFQDLMKAVNQPASQTNLDGRRKSINKFASIEDIEREVKALKSEVTSNDTQRDANLIWDALERRIEENLAKQKGLENLKREFKESAVKRTNKELCKEEMRRLLESQNEMEPVFATSLRQGKPERGKSSGEWEVSYELVNQVTGGSELEVYRLEQSRRRPSDLSVSDLNPVTPIGERFFGKVHVGEGKTLVKVVHLRSGLQVIALSSENGTSELALYDRSSYQMRHLVTIEGTLTAVDSSNSKDSIMTAVSKPNGPTLISFFAIKDKQKLINEFAINLSESDFIVDLVINDSNDAYLLSNKKLMKLDSKGHKIEQVCSFEDGKRLLSTGNDDWLLVVVGGVKQSQIVPFSLLNRVKLSPLELSSEVEAEQSVLATIGDQTQLVCVSKGRLQSYLLAFSHSKTSYRLAKTSELAPTTLVRPTDYCKLTCSCSGSFDVQPLDFVVRELVCTIPLKVCCFQGNEFVLLSNEVSLSTDTVSGTYDLEERLKFGHLSNALSYWNKAVKVVASSTVGSQNECTMTAKSDNKTLFVVLNFGLQDQQTDNSQTRQLTSTLMSALSDLWLVEPQSSVLSIVDGSQMLKGSEKVFKGSLAVRSMEKELFEAISARVDKEGTGNFVSSMFQEGLKVVGKQEWSVVSRLAGRFQTGSEFETFLKMILSRLALQDFSSLKDSELEHRLKWLLSNIDHCLKFGSTDSRLTDKEAKALVNVDNRSEVVNEWSSEFSYNDSDVSFGGSKLAPIELFESICKRSETESDLWDRRYREFVTKAIQFRVNRVKEWLKLNTKRFKSNELIDRFELSALRAVALFEGSLTVCEHKCSRCFALCTYFEGHSNQHDCGAISHHCLANCSYCGDQKCSLAYGHKDKHLCNAFSHKCRQKCEIESCDHLCQSVEGHLGSHKCVSQQHDCLKPCSVPNCQKKCKVPLETSHDLHVCKDNQCPGKCSFVDCQLRCVVQDHFHLSGNSEGRHLCGNEHPCPEKCQSAGNCRVIVERIIQSEKFRGEREAFSYHKYHQSSGIKEKCIRNVPVGQLVHEGGHVHTDTDFEVHTCTERCPTCGSYCDLQVGHEGVHSTNHKNMESCRLVSDQRMIEIGDHKYVVGESSAAEMCHTFCQRLGRGHVHLVRCGQTKERCTSQVDGKRVHETREYGPDFKVSKDEMSHDAYWEMVNFEDPSSEGDKELFRKCPFYCGSEEHGSQRNYCQLDLWHKKTVSLSEIGKTRGCLSADGHYFVCEHKHQAKYHFVLCLDDSGSMNGKPWEVLSEAVRVFAQSRLSNRGDRLTVIQFNENPIVMCESIPFDHFDVDKHLKFRAGGTSFGNAILHAQTVIRTHINDGLLPVFVFMSDGKSNSGETEIKGLAEEFSNKGLRIFTLAFDSFSSGGSGPSETGRRADKSLRKLAEASGGTHLSSISGLELKDLFMEISAAFRTTIGVMAPF